MTLPMAAPKTCSALVSWKKKAVDVGSALVGKASRGAVVRLQLKVHDSVIRDVKFRALGDSAVANGFLAEMITGRSLEEAERLASAESKSSGAALVKQAIQVAVADYMKKHESA